MRNNNIQDLISNYGEQKVHRLFLEYIEYLYTKSLKCDILEKCIEMMNDKEDNLPRVNQRLY